MGTAPADGAGLALLDEFLGALVAADLVRDAAVHDARVLLARQAEVAQQVGPRRRQDRLAPLVHEAGGDGGGRGPAMAAAGHTWSHLATGGRYWQKLTSGHRLYSEFW